MKKIVTAVFTLILLAACNNNGSKDQRILSSSSGNINSLSVVIDNELWEGSVGEKIRNIVGSPVYGLPQEEPLFYLRQMEMNLTLH